MSNEPGELGSEARFHWNIADDFTLFLARISISAVWKAGKATLCCGGRVVGIKVIFEG